MLYNLSGELPKHHYCWVDSSYTHNISLGYIPVVWFGLVSYPSRMWGCTVMLECGAIYRNIPAHALAFKKDPKEVWKPKDAQTWDCYGYGFSVLEYRYLQGLECLVHTNNQKLLGEYLFTAVPIGDGFSAYPDQAKEFTFVKLHNGRLTVQPTNHIIFNDKSFTNNELRFPIGLKRQNEIWRSEYES